MLWWPPRRLPAGKAYSHSSWAQLGGWPWVFTFKYTFLEEVPTNSDFARHSHNRFLRHSLSQDLCDFPLTHLVTTYQNCLFFILLCIVDICFTLQGLPSQLH